ncbi:hypothetical protein M408DRAFT_331459 [Serendipita vermifera MAFF 305830]|uniref:CUE domain-containing protein n=1 Tax=Serendipita vermifera MAFF 305830 TaxID=933852 RepID=A0A0C2X6R6_SERVB|nr:hypothetical protein M408DRAFT_331459 [Serendipita vermifera MAFF 305830]
MEAEIVNVIIAVAVIYFVVKWATSGGANSPAGTPGNPDIAKILGFKPKRATPEMIASVRAAFPDIPTDNIHYDLLRTGSVETTVNRLLERGFLDAPPPAYRRAFPVTTALDERASTASSASKQPTKAQSAPMPSLIQRFQLQSKVSSDGSAGDEVPAWDGTGPIPSAAKGKGRAGSTPVTAPATGAAVWEATSEKREESLQKRKEAMILAARQRLLEKQAASKASS